MSIQQQLLIDLFDRYHNRGMEAYREGDHPTARKNLLQAAEILFKLAAQSSGQLRTSRMERADKLFELAKSIQPKANVRKSTAKQADGEGTDGDGNKWVVTDLPDVSLEDVAGLEDVKATIRRRVIYPFEHPEIMALYRKRSGGGILLYGPPGTGKTMLAKAVANEVAAPFFSVRCSDIMSKWVGEAEGNLKKLFEAARQSERAVVFFDETEAIVAKRGGHSTVMNRVIPEFLAQVDGISGGHSGLLLLGATNRPWDMDEAALRPGRFDELIYVPLPDETARTQIISDALRGIAIADDTQLDWLVSVTEGYSGADCVALCDNATDGPVERHIATGLSQCVEKTDFDRALRLRRKSVPDSLLGQYSKFGGAV